MTQLWFTLNPDLELGKTLLFFTFNFHALLIFCLNARYERRNAEILQRRSFFSSHQSDQKGKQLKSLDVFENFPAFICRVSKSGSIPSDHPIC